MSLAEAPDPTSLKVMRSRYAGARPLEVAENSLLTSAPAPWATEESVTEFGVPPEAVAKEPSNM